MSRNSRAVILGTDRTNSIPDAIELIDYGARFAYGPSADKDVVLVVAQRLNAHQESYGSLQLDPHIGLRFETAVESIFERGWQPAELVHATRKGVGTGSVSLLTEIIAAHSSRTSALTIAPEMWRSQLTELNIIASVDSTKDRVAHWRALTPPTPVDGWCIILTLLGFLATVGAIQALVPPPSRWGSAPGAARTHRVGDSKVLATIRGLLAKAESTQFPAEAELLSAKAQDLMTRYAIDTAVLDAQSPRSLADEVTTRRIMVASPYSEAKMLLLHCVSTANGTKTMRLKRYALISVVGLPVDLDLCELLYTSLLIQSSTALAGMSGTAEGRARSFRKAFLIGYARRIGERLLETKMRARDEASVRYGSTLVPILAEREEAVSTVFTGLFPSLRKTRLRSNNAAGSRAGRIAAERADLTGGRADLTGARRGIAEADLAS